MVVERGHVRQSPGGSEALVDAASQVLREQLVAFLAVTEAHLVDLDVVWPDLVTMPLTASRNSMASAKDTPVPHQVGHAAPIRLRTGSRTWYRSIPYRVIRCC